MATLCRLISSQREGDLQLAYLAKLAKVPKASSMSSSSSSSAGFIGACVASTGCAELCNTQARDEHKPCHMLGHVRLLT